MRKEVRSGISEVRNQTWGNFHPISHLAYEKWEVGWKQEFSFLKVYPKVRTRGEGCGGGAEEAAERRGQGEDKGEADYWTHLRREGVQSADIGWSTGNGKKLSNRQACCLAQLCLAAD